jgi:hypothetical protein
MAQRVILLLAVAAASLLAADARPCHTFFFSFPADPNPGGDGAVHHQIVPRVAVFRIRRLGPHHHQDHRQHHHLHSIPFDPASVQIRRPEHPRLAVGAEAAAAVAQDRARDILVVVVGLLIGVACGALTAASLYLIWSVLAGAAPSSPYDQLYGDDEASDNESPKKVGHVIIQELQVQDGGKN